MTTQYRFGDFKLLPAERLLFRRGSEVALTARAFEVLVAFAERAGQLLSKDDLLKRVWAGQVVEENNLAVQVAALRKVLGAQAITTVPGHGYRFALDVIEVTGIGPDRSGPRGQGNLPVRLPSLIGRAAELAKAVALLRSHPMLTLCGGPGFGKTRLAQELALQLREQYADGAWCAARRHRVEVSANPWPSAKGDAAGELYGAARGADACRSHCAVGRRCRPGTRGARSDAAPADRGRRPRLARWPAGAAIARSRTHALAR